MKGNAASASFRYVNGVALGAGYGLAINLKNLEFMAMQMHGMPHRSWIRKHHLYPLSFLNPVGIAVRVETIVQSPGVFGSWPSIGQASPRAARRPHGFER